MEAVRVIEAALRVMDLAAEMLPTLMDWPAERVMEPAAGLEEPLSKARRVSLRSMVMEPAVAVMTRPLGEVEKMVAWAAGELPWLEMEMEPVPEARGPLICMAPAAGAKE